MEVVDKEILNDINEDKPEVTEVKVTDESLPQVRVYPMGQMIVFEVGDVSHAFAKGSIAVKKINRKGDGPVVAVMMKNQKQQVFGKMTPTTVLTFKAEQMGCKSANKAVSKIIPLMI